MDRSLSAWTSQLQAGDTSRVALTPDHESRCADQSDQTNIRKINSERNFLLRHRDERVPDVTNARKDAMTVPASITPVADAPKARRTVHGSLQISEVSTDQWSGLDVHEYDADDSAPHRTAFKTAPRDRLATIQKKQTILRLFSGL